MVFFPVTVLLFAAVPSGIALGLPVRAEVEASCQGDCPPGWVSFKSRCFQFVGAKKDWADAEAHCLAQGANLVSVHSEEESQFLQELYKSHDLNERPFWIGLTDCQKEHSWMWSDGSKLDFTRWYRSEPNNLGCVSTNWSVEKAWNNTSCKSKYSFICALRTESVGLV